MADINLDELGPVDYVVVRFPADKADFSGAMAEELKKLVESETVRVLDLVVVTKAEDGTVELAELSTGMRVKSASFGRSRRIFR